jgi:hypothetical protein
MDCRQSFAKMFLPLVGLVQNIQHSLDPYPHGLQQGARGLA